jgi:hypothetical protein
MKTILFFCSVLTLGSLSAGHNYWAQYYDSEIGSYMEIEDFPKCLVLVDLIKSTKDPAKLVALKSQLEVNVLVILDGIDYGISFHELGEDEMKNWLLVRSEVEKLLDYIE